MKLTELQKKDITDKNQRLNDIKPILKTEFIGIDGVIDDVIEAIRPFYIFPKSLKRPLVVNLFGMTATGKSHLVERIVELLQLKNKFIRFDVGEYTGNDYKLRSDLSDEVSKLNEKDIIISFDEFQFGRTIDELGKEVPSNAMRPVWDLLDSGKIYKWDTNSHQQFMWNLVRLLEECKKYQFEIVDGMVMDKIKEYNRVFKDYNLVPFDFDTVDAVVIGEYNRIPEEFKKNSKFTPSNKEKRKNKTNTQSKNETPKEFWYSPYEILNSDVDSYSGKTCITGSWSMGFWRHFKNPYLIKATFLKSFFEMNPNLFDNNDSLTNIRNVINDIIKNKSIDEIIDFIKKECWANFSIMTADDYSQSLIFCIGNIDEAYHMHHSSDPDADADIFYEHSLKITVPKMKHALSRRFRMEQIGRLGNNHIIYPAFNKASYAKIIKKHIDIRKKHFETEFGINLTFDESIHDIIYKEGVFPTQGVRPLLSTFNTMLDSYISKIISDLILNHSNVQNLLWKFDGITEKYILEIQDETKTKIGEFQYDVKLNIDKLRKSDFSQRQAYTAVHEAGHAVVACVMAGLIPKEVVSKTASVAEGFCRTEWPDINTKELMYKQIMVCLGGIEAEKIIFGEEFLSDGTGSDLEKATTTASLMVKYYGMTNHNFHITIKATANNEFSSVHDLDNKIESEVKNILDKAQKDVKECLSVYKLFLLDLSDHLSNNSKIVQEDLKAIAVKYIKDTEIKDKDKYYDFKSIIKGLKQAEEAKFSNKSTTPSKVEIEPSLRYTEVVLNAVKKDKPKT